MPRPPSKGPRRFPVAHLWIAMMLLFAVVAVACSEEEPTPTPGLLRLLQRHRPLLRLPRLMIPFQGRSSSGSCTRHPQAKTWLPF